MNTQINPSENDGDAASETASARGWLPSQRRIATLITTVGVAIATTAGTAVAQTESEVCGAEFMEPIGTTLTVITTAGPALTFLATLGFFAASGLGWGGVEKSARYRKRAIYAGVVTVVLISSGLLLNLIGMVAGETGCLASLL